MGGSGIAAHENNLLSILNPATLGGSRLTFVDGSVRYNVRTISIGDATQFNRIGNIGYFFLSLPISQRLNTTLGFNNGGTVSYSYVDRVPIIGTSDFTIRELNGDGQLNNINLINGIKLSKKLRVGIEAIYTFGSLTYTEYYRADIAGNSLLKTSLVEKNTYNLLKLRSGVHYSVPLQGGVIPRVLNFGATLEGGRSLRAEQLIVSEQVGVRNNASALNNDTFNLSSNAIVQLAPRIAVGISYQKEGNYMLALDLFHQQWSAYKNELRPEQFKNIFGMAAGVSWVPSLSGNLIKRTAYRFGFHAEQSPISIDNQRVNDLGISFGLSIPVDKSSRLSLSAVLGRRQANSTIPFSEQYLQFSLGYSITDRWFVRFKED